MSFSFPFPLCLAVMYYVQNTGRGAERISNTESTLVPMEANWRDCIFCAVFCEREIALSVLFFRVLDASCCQKEGACCCVDMLRYLDTQLARSLGPTIAPGMPANVPKSVKSRAQCLTHRAYLACHTGPPGSESSLQVLPGCFHASNQQPGRHAPPPCRPHHCQTPQQGLGRSTYCTGYSGTA